jgi:hypothetical protein
MPSSGAAIPENLSRTHLGLGREDEGDHAGPGTAPRRADGGRTSRTSIATHPRARSKEAISFLALKISIAWSSSPEAAADTAAAAISFRRNGGRPNAK